METVILVQEEEKVVAMLRDRRERGQGGSVRRVRSGEQRVTPCVKYDPSKKLNKWDAKTYVTASDARLSALPSLPCRGHPNKGEDNDNWKFTERT